MKNGAAAFHYEAVALKNLMQSISMIKEIKIFGKIRYFRLLSTLKIDTSHIKENFT